MTEQAEKKSSAAEKMVSALIETIADNIADHKAAGGGGGGEESSSAAEKASKLVERQKNVHNVLGGGQAADVLLWRNKTISSSFLVVATIIWIFFEWLDYNFMTITCFLLVIGMVLQFLASTASTMLNMSYEVPRFKIPDELFANMAVSVGGQINKFLGVIQDVACGKDLKQFGMVVLGLWAAAVIGSWCNFLTVIYVGFVAAHTLPVLYEKYQDQVDDFAYKLIGQMQNVFSRIPNGNFSSKKKE